MFEFVCERIIPGCTHKEEDENRDELMERVGTHLREQHDLDHHEASVAEALKTSGITFIRPA